MIMYVQKEKLKLVWYFSRKTWTVLGFNYLIFMNFAYIQYERKFYAEML